MANVIRFPSRSNTTPRRSRALGPDLFAELDAAGSWQDREHVAGATVLHFSRGLALMAADGSCMAIGDLGFDIAV